MELECPLFTSKSPVERGCATDHINTVAIYVWHDTINVQSEGSCPGEGDGSGIKG